MLPLCAGMAQLVEQLIRNQQVASSSLATSSKRKATFKSTLNVAFIFCFIQCFYAEKDTHNFALSPLLRFDCTALSFYPVILTALALPQAFLCTAQQFLKLNKIRKNVS